MNRRRRWSGGRDHVDAAGEYVSAQSQADNADLKRETTELKTDNQGEHKELAAIYVVLRPCHSENRYLFSRSRGVLSIRECSCVTDDAFNESSHKRVRKIWA